ncbi:WD40 repeat domain-containing protein [Streptomyces niveiscabiei]|uniref:WD40 repeat domain-containing protein n=1 Tax=Streptomyces niveiscabiei TaxID=164115 RepID=UPI0006EB4650|nr:WD40 repeat domain-containing protein [Streptomyces niveiscabiei]
MRHGALRITDIAVTTIDRHPVAVTGSPRDGVRLHDLASGEPLADYRSPGDDQERVYSVDVLRMDGRPVIAGAGHGGLVWMWDLLDGDAHRAVWRGLLVDGAPVLAGVQAEYGPTTGHARCGVTHRLHPRHRLHPHPQRLGVPGGSTAQSVSGHRPWFRQERAARTIVWAARSEGVSVPR